MIIYRIGGYPLPSQHLETLAFTLFKLPKEIRIFYNAPFGRDYTSKNMLERDKILSSNSDMCVFLSCFGV